VKPNSRGTLYLTGIFTGLLAAAILHLISAKPRGIPIELVPPGTPAPFRVHVRGAVESPGVYTLPAESIVQDAVEAAGGARLDASFDSINLAAPLHDGQLISIPVISDSTPPGQLTQSSSETLSQKININTAREAELESLPGIGPSLAASIVEYRQQNGPFSELDDLLQISGIGPSKLAQLEDFVIVR
jgi:competence protein ComEA